MPTLSVNHSQRLTVPAKREPKPRLTVKRAGETIGLLRLSHPPALLEQNAKVSLGKITQPMFRPWFGTRNKRDWPTS
jgi:hypothetical protein